MRLLPMLESHLGFIKQLTTLFQLRVGLLKLCIALPQQVLRDHSAAQPASTACGAAGMMRPL
jgi:hypothetical protein